MELIAMAGLRWLVVAVVALVTLKAAVAQSVYPLKVDDPHVVFLEKGQFGVVGDGVADDADAIQAAIDKVVATTVDGVVMLPEGRYRLGKTVNLWTGIRLIGYGAKRPVLVLGKNTPGFQTGESHYMVYFAARKPMNGGSATDANEFTFYSGMSNIDMEMEEGNAAAVAVRFHVAQHSFLTHMNIHAGTAKAALEEIGNQAYDLHIDGGEYGIITDKTSPAWQFILMDSTIEGQRKAAIHTWGVGFTLIRDRFKNVPVVVEIDTNHVEQLYARDVIAEDVSKAFLVQADATNFLNQVTMEHVACWNCGHFVEGEKSAAKKVMIDHLAMGLEVGPDGREKGYQVHRAEHALTAMPVMAKSDVPEMPAMGEWVNVRSLGVKGDGGTDDTAALQAAIDGHKVLYLPFGAYRISAPLKLKADTVLIGLHPTATTLMMWDEAEAYKGEGEAVPMVIAPKGGTNQLMGLGVATGFNNPRAAGVVWMAGEHSLLEDVNFPGGRGRTSPVLAPAFPRPAGPPQRVGPNYASTQQPSLIVRDGGGGVIRDIWTPNTNAKAGFVVENTSTPTSVYQLSCEHHMHNEVMLRNVQNWKIYALQTEEEKPAGAESQPIAMENVQHVLFANTFMYRVSRTTLPKTDAITAKNTNDVRFENVHNFSQTRLAFDNTVHEEGSGVMVRSHDFTIFTLNAGMKAPMPMAAPAMFEKGAKLEKIGSGFSNAAGLAVDDAGKLYFTDADKSTIYRWNEGSKQAEVMATNVVTPMVLGFVAPDHLLAIDYAKAVYSLKTAGSGAAEKVEEQESKPGTVLLLPKAMHHDLPQLERLLNHTAFIYARGSNTAIVGFDKNEHRGYFYAPGTNTAIIAGGTWRPMLQSSSLIGYAAGDEHLLTSEDDAKTYRAKRGSGEEVTTTLFTQRGGVGVATDDAGNTYIAEGQVYVYDKAGKQIAVLEVPERPSGLAFGGADHKTLYVAARTSLYAIRTVAAGK